MLVLLHYLRGIFYACELWHCRRHNSKENAFIEKVNLDCSDCLDTVENFVFCIMQILHMMI